MQLNPIFALELRTRWRSGRSYLLLLGVALALSLLTGFIYWRAVVDSGLPPFDPSNGNPMPAITNDSARLGLMGRELFIALAHVNIVAWLYIAAASAATGIARERERGLLESLQLSHIGATGQIVARFAANLMLPGALQLVLLPIYAVAFLMRGVAPLEVAQAFVVVALSAIVGTSIGLWFSARSHRPTNALFGALGAITIFSIIVFYYGSWGYILGLDFMRLRWLEMLHPTTLFGALTDPNFIWFGLASPQDTLILISAAWLFLSGGLLWGAIRNVNRVLPVAAWQSNSILVEKLRARQAVAPPQSKAGQRASGALLTDVPLDRFVKFSDPLLAREVKARFRLRRAGFWVGLVRFALFAVAASLWLYEIFWLFDSRSRDQMAPYALSVILLGGTLCLSVLAATSWTRERESGTWEALKLSLLPPRQILRAKWLSPLVSFAYYSAPLWILLPIGALFVDVGAFVVGTLTVLAWLGLTVALGLLMSWRFRNGTAAIAWTVGILAMLIFGFPALMSRTGIEEMTAQWRYGVSDHWDRDLFNPYRAASQTIDDDLAERYRAATGRVAPSLKQRFLPLASDQPYSQLQITPQWQDFQRWGDAQIAAAELYKWRMHAWNPVETLSRLFVGNQPNYSYSWRRHQEVRRFTPRELLDFALWSTLPPIALTLVLLLRLRRDVRREQLDK